jgi:hypothetical protein
MTEREIMLAVNSDGSISEMDVAELGPKAMPMPADEEIEDLVAQILGEKNADRVRDFRAELKTKD